MKRATLALLASFLPIPAAIAAAPRDVIVPIHQFIDEFNGDDVKSACAAYSNGGFARAAADNGRIV
jgi:hypothetical protein